MALEIQKNTQSLIERLFTAGGHFGFSKSRRHPTAAPYIFGNKQGTDIIDLEKTIVLLEKAKEVISDAGKQGKTVLFVGTKEEVTKIVESHAKHIEMPHIVNRWVGGTLTNFSEIKKRIHRLHELVEQGASGALERKYTKKERVIIGRELDKLTLHFSGISKMERLPSIVVIVDPRHDAVALREAIQMNIPVIAIASSDTNLKQIAYPVLINDNLQASVTLALDELTEAYLNGKAEFTPAKREDPKKR